MDIVDVTGVHSVDIEGKLTKHRLDSRGQEIGVISHIDESGHAEVDPVAQMQPSWRNSNEGRAMTEKVAADTMEALKNNEGCKLSGFVFINKVPGNFHISGHHYPEAV